MRETWLDTRDDLNWLKDLGKDLGFLVPAKTIAAILYGNEDCPEKIEFYQTDDYRSKPISTWFNPVYSANN